TASTGSSRAIASIAVRVKCTVDRPRSAARARASSTIAGAASIPSTVPAGPTSRAATNDTSPNCTPPPAGARRGEPQRVLGVAVIQPSLQEQPLHLHVGVSEDIAAAA